MNFSIFKVFDFSGTSKSMYKKKKKKKKKQTLSFSAQILTKIHFDYILFCSSQNSSC